MFKISLFGTTNENDQRYAVYNLHDAATLEIVYVGFCKLTDVLKTPDIRGIPQFDPNKPHVIDVQSVYNTAAEATHAASKLAAQHNRPILNRLSTMQRHLPIECVETGQRWPSAAECARQQGINPGNLANHLNNRAGFRSVRGLTYRRVTQ